MYDVVVVGAGISGSVCAKILAENGYKVLLTDRTIPPRDKVCSGVQFRYMEKLIGEKIPEEVLCRNELRKIRLTRPSGKSLEGSMTLLNYWRRDFDHWLNRLAIEAGAEARWGAAVNGIEPQKDSVVVKQGPEKVETRYVVGGDGVSPGSFTRKWLCPDNFSDNVTGASLNYYYKGNSSVKPDTLYLYYRKGLSDLMYSWLYYKDDLLVVGTSSTESLSHYATEFLGTVRRDFKLEGEEVGRDGYSTYCMGGILLGKARVLLVGDAAGMLDLYRGVGMDTAALSGRICAKSLIETFQSNSDAMSVYQGKSRKLVEMIERNIQRQEKRYASDEALEDSFSTGNIIRGTLTIAWATLWNRFCKPEDIVLLPP